MKSAINTVSRLRVLIVSIAGTLAWPGSQPGPSFTQHSDARFILIGY